MCTFTNCIKYFKNRKLKKEKQKEEQKLEKIRKDIELGIINPIEHMCYICCDDFKDINVCEHSSCDYQMCDKCYIKYYRENTKCPACRNEKTTYFLKNIVLKREITFCDHIIDIILSFILLIFFTTIIVLFGRLLYFIWISIFYELNAIDIIEKYYWLLIIYPHL